MLFLCDSCKFAGNERMGGGRISRPVTEVVRISCHGSRKESEIEFPSDFFSLGLFLLLISWE